MKQILSKELILNYSNNFPYTRVTNKKYKSRKRNRVTIGIGGNQGDVKKCFNKLFLHFQNDARFTLLKTSPLLKNPPFGYLEQQDFLNGIMVLKTNLSALECLRVFQRYENRYKRVRSFQDAPRTLDIDIIFFNDLKLDTPELTIPHKGYLNRQSVLIPLSFVQ